MENELENFLRNHGASLNKQTPDPAVLQRILKHMQKKSGFRPKQKVIQLGAWRWAAACLVFLIGGMLLWVQQKRSSDRITAHESASRLPLKDVRKEDSLTPAVVVFKNNRKAKFGSALPGSLKKHKQVLTYEAKMHSLPLKEMIYAGLKNGALPASRINAVNAAYTLKRLDNDVVNALLETLNTDPNANVRLAVLDGLAQSKQGSYVCKKLVISLEHQQDPVVQIALINLLTGIGESGILKELDRLVRDDNTMKGVKDCAYASIFRLRSS